MKDDTISRAAALDFIDSMNWCDEISDEAFKKITIHLENLPSAQTELENKIRAIGYTGREGRIYIGGRLFSIRELAQ